MPTITINGKPLSFAPGQTILQVALQNEIEIPHYCYHPGLSVVANCRICLAEVWAPNPKNNNTLEPMPKLLPTCQTPCGDGQVVYIDSPKAIANQKAVMEYLLINHPVDCPVCDQAGECYLQDYSYQYGRGQSRFQEQKIKQPKKDLGPHVLLYYDRCIMCTRCVRFTQEVTGTGELMVQGRGAMEQIDVFPGLALSNELSGNVVDICPVGALLDKEFLFQQRVWFLEKTPSIDGLTASGDNIWVEHNKGVVYRVKPRTNHDVNRWWITDEVRYGWSFVHSEQRLTMPRIKGEDPFEPAEAGAAYEVAYEAVNARLGQAKRIAALLSPMLSCEDAYLLVTAILQHDPHAVLGVGPIPTVGKDKTFKDGFTMLAEKAPNARGVRRVLEKFSRNVMDFDAFAKALKTDSAIDGVLITGNYPSQWVVPSFVEALEAHKNRFVVLIDTLETALTSKADVVLPGATWMEKAGTFENHKGRLQSFERAIEPIDFCKSESQIALDLIAQCNSSQAARFNAANTRQFMADNHGLVDFTTKVHQPSGLGEIESDMQLVEL
ncbi:MAG TPA: molybdopterin-dependent oxidoreductase [Phycisphaerales bacterium]|nr:molybdopterin-dependent oxidoreductase [Phycisphaerales bacterium]